MELKKRILITAGVAAGLVAAVAGTAIASGAADDNEQPITGEALDRASAVALDHLGQGRVTETEVGDEDSYYEVEVTLDDGSQVDVQLTEKFEVVSADPDVEGEAGDTD